MTAHVNRWVRTYTAATATGIALAVIYCVRAIG